MEVKMENMYFISSECCFIKKLNFLFVKIVLKFAVSNIKIFIEYLL